MCRRTCVAIVAFAAIACADQFVAPDAVPTNANVFDQLHRSVDLHYAHFVLKDINWDSVGRVHRPRAIAAVNDTALANVLGDMLRSLRDPHVSLTPFGRGSTIRYHGRADSAAAHFQAASSMARYAGASPAHDAGRVRAAMLQQQVGYVQLLTFRGHGVDMELDSALAAIPHARVLILDVRNNWGGHYAQAIAAAGRFTSVTTRFGYLRFRNGPAHTSLTGFIAEEVRPAGRQFGGSVILLTNRRTVSSAEVFTLAMRALPNVTVVGDTTAGASGGPTARTLRNGWAYEISEWVEYTLDKRPYENTGLAPHITVPALNNTRTLQYDDAELERAIGIARNILSAAR